MNNKEIGTDFEKYMCEHLASLGYWVHFISPDKRGSQPFDIIAVKNNIPLAVECKTLSKNVKVFSIDRLQENQKTAFQKWIKCGNEEPLIFILHGDEIRVVEWSRLEQEEKVNVKELELWHIVASAE